MNFWFYLFKGTKFLGSKRNQIIVLYCNPLILYQLKKMGENECPKFITDGPGSFAYHAWEDYFEKLPFEVYNENRVNNTGSIITKESKIVPGANGNFAAKDFRKGECIDWGIAVVLNGYDINKTDALYTWSSWDRKSAAALSGPALFYNTMGDASNMRCVPYHKEKRYENYALRDIKKGEEITMRYDSMNWREAMKEVKSIVGELKGAHNQV